MTYDIRNPGPGLGQAQKCGRVKPLFAWLHYLVFYKRWNSKIWSYHVMDDYHEGSFGGNKSRMIRILMKTLWIIRVWWKQAEDESKG